MLGVVGAFAGESVKAQTRTATPSFTQQVIQPGTGYDYLSAVTIEAIPIVATDNAAGGKTITIG